MKGFSVRVLILLFLSAIGANIFPMSVHGVTPISTFPWATPQPGFCDLVGLDGFLCEANQPWLAGSDEQTDIAVTGVRSTFSFPNLNPTVIQADNVLGAGIAVYVPSDNPNAAAPGVDFVYYGFVNVDRSGTISFVSSGWITCEWNTCPSPYPDVQSCYQYQGAYFWGTCTGHLLNDRHWQLFVDRFKCSDCSVGDKYLVTMGWAQNSYAIWNYYKNGVLWHSFTYTPPSGWQVGPTFKTGTGQMCHAACWPRWRHFQFGVTSMYDIGQGSGWEVDVDDPQYTNTADLSSWYPLSTVKTLQGSQAFYDNDYAIGSANYLGVVVTGSTSGCDQRATFKDTGASVGSGMTLWANVGSGCSFRSPKVNFTISPNPSTLTIVQGSQSSSTISLTALNGSTTVSLSGFAFDPSAISVSYNPAVVQLNSGRPATSGALISVSNSAAPGQYTYIVQASSFDGIYHDASLTVNVVTAGGSVARGTLITLSDGFKIPVEDVEVGDQVIVYNVPTGYQTIATVEQIRVTVADSSITLHTSAGLPFRADANPLMKLWVLTSNGPVQTPITTIRLGDKIYNYDLASWVTVTKITAVYGGNHTVYDLFTNPSVTSGGQILEYIANGYPDCTPGCKQGPGH